MDTVYLDTETTGLSPDRGDRVVDIAMVDDLGNTVIDTLVDPERPIPAEASGIHHITDEMVAGMPKMDALWPGIEAMTDGKRVIIYNAGFDTRFFPGGLANAASTECAMLRFAKAYGEPSQYGNGYRWQKLALAADHIGYNWVGTAHRALADALACRAIWTWLEENGH
jgi:DNA polymerase-3 subunit epsilon